MNLSNGKIIGIYIGGMSNGRYNIGTFLKYPVEDLIDKFKDSINSKEKIISKIYSIANYSKNETQILDFDNKNKILENELKLEKEKNMILQDKILQLQKLLDNKEKEIEELKLKLEAIKNPYLEIEEKKRMQKLKKEILEKEKKNRKFP
jgi:hypothetical protein